MRCQGWRAAPRKAGAALPKRCLGLSLQPARRGGVRAAAKTPDKDSAGSGPKFLSDLIAFESDVDTPPSQQKPTSDDPTTRAQEIIDRATRVLEEARHALGVAADQQQAPAPAGTPPGGRSTEPVPPSAASTAAPPAAGPGGAAPASPSSSRSGGSGSFSSIGGSRDDGGGGAPSSAWPRAGGSAGAPSSAWPRAGAGGGAAGTAAPPASGQAPSGGSPSASGASLGSADAPVTRRWSSLADDGDLTRSVLQSALDRMQSMQSSKEAPVKLGGRAGKAAPPPGGSGASSQPPGAPAIPASSGETGAKKGGDGGRGAAPSWASALLGPDTFEAGPSAWREALEASPLLLGDQLPPGMQLQAAPRRAVGGAATSALPFAEGATLELPLALELPSQAAGDAARASSAVLPPLQSVVELTSAARPPERGSAPVEQVVEAAGAAAPATATVGRQLADGSGVLADGTQWEKRSGIELGENGYWKRWHLLKGSSGTVEWEEVWWEASDWTGLREMGAVKSGTAADGSAWHETWNERLAYTSNALDSVVERTAHKWAADATAGDEWEERWSEYYHSGGHTAKTADKWGKTGSNVWHERWGEDYDGDNAVVKWTDKWAERLHPDGAREQWGDKWHEEFDHGSGHKNGEVWSVDGGGHRYQRWWGEDHYGDGRVRRHGNSTGGENWDDVTHMDTYYNPIPHFGYKLALDHSPTLKRVALRPKALKSAEEKAAAAGNGCGGGADNPFGPGLDEL